ncbi:hypothetical protein OF83DRAFT_592877 [Amylostereum chailletii]|nr:hypothetical protein OF83DRAFT_592877 [Amylostereum chailletii]
MPAKSKQVPLVVRIAPRHYGHFRAPPVNPTRSKPDTPTPTPVTYSHMYHHLPGNRETAISPSLDARHGGGGDDSSSVTEPESPPVFEKQPQTGPDSIGMRGFNTDATVSKAGSSSSRGIHGPGPVPTAARMSSPYGGLPSFRTSGFKTPPPTRKRPVSSSSDAHAQRNLPHQASKTRGYS